MGKVIVRTGMLVAAALTAGLSLTACSSGFAPVGQGGDAGTSSSAIQAGQDSTGQNSAGQSGEDPGCQALASQISGISSQLSATSGNYSAQVPVLQTWYGDLQAAQQESTDGVVAGAIGDTAAGLENVIVDEQNLMDDPSTGFDQLDSDDSSYQSDVSALETACGFSG
jgi:hypothetical protein